MSKWRCFISHASEDAPLAETVAGEFEQRGLECWMAPRNIPPGGNYAEEIPRAIGESDAMVVLVSKAALGSRHVMRELHLGVDRGMAIFPIRLEDVVPAESFGYLLGPAQWVDAFPEPRESRLRAACGGIAEKISGKVDGVETGEPAPKGPASGGEPAVAGRRGVLVAVGGVLLMVVVALVVLSGALGGRPIDDERLREVADFEVDITVSGGEGVYREGDQLFFDIEVPQDCFLVLAQDDGTILFPNEFVPDAHVVGGLKATIPPEGDRYFKLTLGVVGDGQEKVLAVAATDEARLVEIFGEDYEEAKRHPAGGVVSRGMTRNLMVEPGDDFAEAELGIGLVVYQTTAAAKGS